MTSPEEVVSTVHRLPAVTVSLDDALGKFLAEDIPYPASLKGCDIEKDAAVVKSGEQLGVSEIGLLATAGILMVKVYPTPTVALLSTGDELVEPTTACLGHGQALKNKMRQGEKEEEQSGQDGCKIRVSNFDFSVENHVNAIETISKLCGEVERDSLEITEIQCRYSPITFLREWRHFNYEPRTIKFAHELGVSQHKGSLGEITLPQFSSAAVPKSKVHGDITSPKSSKDFVMHVGGSVWALDWCPRNHERSASHVKCEFLAVASHPPNSYYHKLGTLLSGRGVVQIWCILNDSRNEETPPLSENSKRKTRPGDACNEKLALIKRPKGKHVGESGTGETMKATTEFKRPRGRPRKKKEDLMNDEAYQCKKPRGWHQKKTSNNSVDSVECHHQYPQVLAIEYHEDLAQVVAIEGGALANAPAETMQKNKAKKQKYPSIALQTPLAVEYPEDPAPVLAIEGALLNVPAETKQKNKAKKQKNPTKPFHTSVSVTKIARHGRKLESISKVGGECATVICPTLLTQNEDQSSIMNYQTNKNLLEEPTIRKCSLDNVSCDVDSDSCAIPENIVLPRLVFCLAHDGKVVWDMKWRPCHISDSKSLHQMGYLAVLLGNGSLEVWDVPLPNIANAIYTLSCKEGIDPRFVKLQPVFKCSIAKCGEMESIPLTVEWSPVCPHDYLLAGCHDGKVALWKFSADATSGDTRPLLCFSADTVPIRAVAWAPSESDQESANVVLTAGHGGLKFWDLRDPFRPLWHLQPAPKLVYSLDWLSDPRCVILSMDDGTIRLLSLMRAAFDAHVNGKPTVRTKQQVMHLLTCPSFAIWSVHTSRKTGMVAYCSADGTVGRFQITTKAVEKDPSKNRAPHFKIWSLSKDESSITVSTSLPDTPLSFKKPVNNVGDSSRTMKSLFESSQIKTSNKAKATTVDNQPSAICYENDSSTSVADEETSASLSKQSKLISKNTSKKIIGEDLALVCIDEERHNIQEKEIEVIPPKIVAMHRVRWNMNQDSERWLCSGGAAGIVRCQEILFSDLDKDVARKR
ncbi:Transducin/WD40 repeat-like superfamily protein [Euphorbia peplus]|nr:Transducin/WD40 repeat-like superfamily protein [Euphorbia peplus]